MARGRFFGKSSKKQQKLQQKQAQQQQIIQQKHQSSNFNTQAGSADNTNNSTHNVVVSEPPLGLGGPRQTAPTQSNSSSSSRLYDPRVTAVHYQPSSNSPQNIPQGLISAEQYEYQQEQQQLLYNQQQHQQQQQQYQQAQHVSALSNQLANLSQQQQQLYEYEQQQQQSQQQQQLYEQHQRQQQPQPQQQLYEENIHQHSQQYLPKQSQQLQQQQQHAGTTPPFASQPGTTPPFNSQPAGTTPPFTSQSTGNTPPFNSQPPGTTPPFLSQPPDTTPPFLSQQPLGTTPPFINQPYLHQGQQQDVSPRQQQHQAHQQQHQQQQFAQQNMLHPGQQLPPQHTILAQNITPTVDLAIDEIWRCETDDFRSASHSIQMLRLAIVAEWESQQIENNATGEQNYGAYDPSDTFLSLQGATLRFHARFESMKIERDAATTGTANRGGSSSVHNKQSGHSVGGGSVAGSATVTSQSLNGVEWELTEQAAWEVWEESVRASAALTHACVGPAWRRQLKLRRQLIRESEMRLLHQPHLQARFAGDNMSVGGSSAGGLSMGSTIVSMDISNPQSSGRYLQGQGSVAAPQHVWQPPTDILEMLSSYAIPEVLPAAMIRFSASVVETSIPPLRKASTKIYWDSDKAGISPLGNEALLTVLGKQLHDERRWLRRRKRLGDTQRDLAFGLFCGGNENDGDTDNGANPAGDAQGTGDVTENNWSIPGAHTPVAVMINSWLETCRTAWPVPIEIEGGLIPSHFKEVASITVEEINEGGNVSSESVPPTEIVLNVPNVEMSLADPRRNASPEPNQYRKFSLWGEIVDLSRVDWWYTLRVLRDCSDLVSAGWRPPPAGQIGEGIISSLIEIAETGINWHLAGEDGPGLGLPEDQIQKERLVACSCASESLVALKNLATREVIPVASLRPLAMSLCQLISAAETSMSSVGSRVGSEVVQDSMFEKEIRDVRTFVASNSAELLWVLLSNEGTACPTTDVLLDAIDMDLHTQITDENRSRVEESISIASGAIRALSAAMWGDPPTVKGVPLLRFFWEHVIDLFGAVTATYFQADSDAPTATFDIAGHKTSIIDLEGRVNDSPCLTIILEIILAFQRLVDSEMVYGAGDLVVTEWESFVKAVDIGISPWLVRRNYGSSLVQEIHIEAMAIFSQITLFLAKCSENESGFHLIVDDDARVYLHQFLLRKIAPLIQSTDSFSRIESHPVGDDASTLALAVIKSSCVIRYLPFKEGDWAKRASGLLASAFLVPKIQPANGHRYIGGYLHHPLVRLEALLLLKSLVTDESSDIDHSTVRDSDSVSTSGVSTITPVSLRSGNGTIPPAFSLFSLTKNLRELHLVLVNSIILPRLEEILSDTTELELSECQPSQDLNVSAVECFDIIEKEFVLRRYAVKMLGMLFRSRTGEAEKRDLFIGLLQKVSTTTPHGIREWVQKQDRLYTSALPLAAGETITPSGFLRGEEMNLRFEAIRQIEVCLGASFSSLPHTHANVPSILKAHCDTARFYTIEYDDGENYKMGLTDRLLMTLASILPIARLSCARNGQAILMSRQHITHNIPSDLLSIVSVDEWLHNISPMVLSETLPIVSEEHDFQNEHGEMAIFVFAKQYHASGKEKEASQAAQNPSKSSRRRKPRRQGSTESIMYGKQGTVVDFEPVAAVIKRVLNAVACSFSDHHDESSSTLLFDRNLSPTSISQLPSILCMICYSIISSFLSHGMAFPGLDDLLWLDLAPSEKSGNEIEVVSRSQAASIFSGVLGHIIFSNIGDEENNLRLGRRVCDVLVKQSMLTDNQKAVQHSCCGLISLLSSLRHNHAKRSAKGKTCTPDAGISESLVSYIEHICTVLRKANSGSDSVLIPLIDAMREAATCTDSVFDFPKPLRRKVFLMLFQPSRSKWELQVVAFQCAVAITNVMSTHEISQMMFFTIGPEKNVKLPNEKRIQPVLIDLLRYRLISARLLRASASSPESHYKPSKVHGRLAREALSLETFPVDVDDLGSEKVAAWKCGDALLSLRLGAEDSLYRGWVEVVIRSPCSRVRRLVKWKKEFITEHPVSFLPFYDQLHPRKKKEIKTSDSSEPENAVAQSREKEPIGIVESEESLEIMARAKRIMARFDSLVESTPLQQHNNKVVDTSDLPSRSASERVGKTTHRRKSSVGENFFKGRQSGAMISSGLKRTLSDGDLKAMSLPVHSEALHARKRTVYKWLQYATGQMSIDVDLIQELERLGFSRSALGIPDNVITPKSYQDLFLHERLKPYAIKPNFHRALNILDRVTPFQTHRIALFYGGPFSTKRNARKDKSDSSKTNKDGDKFLMATQGSTDFWQFAKELGDFVPLRHCKYFSGGLDTSESLSDGSFAIVWFGCQGGSYDLNDPILVDSMVFFHTVTLMPDRVNNRKRHVGNDVVHIVYGLDIDTLDVDHERMAISGQFGFITIYVIPLVHVPLFRVSVHLKAGLDKSICSALDHLVGNWLISRKVGAHFVRNLAMQADVICQSMIEDKLGLVLNTEDRSGRIRDTDRHLG